MKVRSMKGELVDMTALRSMNEKSLAVGNANMNARGDRIVNGRIIKTREEVVEEYYRDNPRAVENSSVALRSIEDEIMTPAEMLKKAEEVGAIKALEPKAVKKKIKFDDDEE